MIRVGLTGTIGSGKSVVAEIFSHLGIKIYHADAEAKKFYLLDEVKSELSQAFGAGIITSEGEIDKQALAGLVFADAASLARLNGIIHPRVEADYLRWVSAFAAEKFTLLEAAILFESGFDRHMEATILVDAPPELCITRVMTRDGVSRESVLARMAHQWRSDKKRELADHIIVNDGLQPLLPQVVDLYNLLSGNY